MLRDIKEKNPELAQMMEDNPELAEDVYLDAMGVAQGAARQQQQFQQEEKPEGM